eukprot:TRINITY_DN53182_c0_g1_i1.p1 TRINITY_DN53182_c0_g1~~TRINITY_DN53182_c0_g1_i1.p1  ORF type:complete len:302 (+),score=39.45 TRINITY_DN53182_c0_g1_i1:61-966(+)
MTGIHRFWRLSGSLAAAASSVGKAESRCERRSDEEHYRKEGFVIIRGALPQTCTRVLRRQFEAKLHTDLTSMRYQLSRVLSTSAIHSPYQRHSIVADLSEDMANALTRILSDHTEFYRHILLSPPDECELVTLGAIVSLPGSESQDVHPDIGQTNCSLVTSFVALQDIDAAMGPTSVYPGTHSEEFHALVRSMPSGAPAGIPAEGFDSYSGRSIDELAPQGVREVTLREGDMLVMDARIHHFGSANTSDRPRYLMQLSLLSSSLKSGGGKLPQRPLGFVYHLDKADEGKTMADFVCQERLL